MQSIMPRPDPETSEALWLACDQSARPFRPGLRHVLLVLTLLVPMTVTASLGTVHFSSTDGSAIASFWPAAAFQTVFSIWFGVWGAIAGVLGPMLGNALIGQSAMLFAPANLIQSCLPGLWFRWRKLDPRLLGWRDWLGLITVCCLANNAIGGLAGVTESFIRDLINGQAQLNLAFWAGKYRIWVLANTVPCLLLAPALLKSASPMVVRDSLFSLKFFDCGPSGRSHPLWLHMSQMPVMVKLMLLTLVAGILPLSVVAGWSVWGALKTSDALAGATNLDAARQIRSEFERHELLLARWAGELDMPGLSQADQERLIANWSQVEGAYQDLRIWDIEQVKMTVLSNPKGVLHLPNMQLSFYIIGDRPTTTPVALAPLQSRPGKALIGTILWQHNDSLTRQWWAVGGVAVLDENNRFLYADLPPALSQWKPNPQQPPADSYDLNRDGKIWHVAEARLDRLGWRFITLTEKRAGQAAILANIPNFLPVMINLAIFGSIIFGSAIARRISGRIMTIAEHVRSDGAKPGKLDIPVSGPDEIGYLAQTLNSMNRNLDEYVKKLKTATAEKERLATEMQLARQVQRSILPDAPPDIEGYEFAFTCRPAREVGGDFFDFITGVDGHMVILIGDAVGKGLKAAMFITETHGLAHLASIEKSSPENILADVNAAILSTRGPSGDFITMICGILQPEHNRLLYANAGHNPPVLIHAGQTKAFDLGGLPLAVQDQVHYPLSQTQIDRGDAIIFYTDGITEATDGNDLFGMARLEAVARQNADLPAEELLKAVIKSVCDFTGDRPQADDMTLVILKRN